MGVLSKQETAGRGESLAVSGALLNYCRGWSAWESSYCNSFGLRLENRLHFFFCLHKRLEIAWVRVRGVAYGLIIFSVTELEGAFAVGR